MGKINSYVDYNKDTKKFEASKGEWTEELPSQTQDNTFSGDNTLSGSNTFSGAVQIMSNLPTSDPTNAGQLWADSGVVTVSSGS